MFVEVLIGAFRLRQMDNVLEWSKEGLAWITKRNEVNKAIETMIKLCDTSVFYDFMNPILTG